MPKYGIALSVVAGDAKNALRSTCADVANYLIGRDADESGAFQRYVWGVGGVPASTGTSPKTGQPIEVDALGLIGYNPDLGQNILVELDAIQKRAGLVQQVAFSPSKSRADAVTYLTQMAGESGCDHVLTIAPGSTIGAANNAALLAKFTALP